MSQYIDRKSSVLQTSICESRFYVGSDFATTLFTDCSRNLVFVCIKPKSKLIKNIIINKSYTNARKHCAVHFLFGSKVARTF